VLLRQFSSPREVHVSVTIIKDLAKAVQEQEQHRKALSEKEPKAVEPGANPPAATEANSPPDSSKDSSRNDT
jgi:hypothetical protein